MHSGLSTALTRMSRRSAAAVVARARVDNPALNAALLRRLSQAPGSVEGMLAAPVFEAAKAWRPAAASFGDLSGELLDARLVEALDHARDYRMPKDRFPYLHQFEAWHESLRNKRSVLVTSGTGSGKTECFLIPILNDVLQTVRPGGGVQAIILYPLNALIESQRERLKAWAEGLDGRVRFALYNGDTPDTSRKAGEKSSKTELNNRKDIRETPPDILVTNITMLEYLLLRSQDRRILSASEGALRWIVLDEAHSYVGSQAAEMALLLRRVRAAFGVTPEQVRLMATSATIGGELDAAEKLRSFTAALAGQDAKNVAVIEGQEDEPKLPAVRRDEALDIDALAEKSAGELWQVLAHHPRLQALRREMNARPISLPEISELLFDDTGHQDRAQAVLDAAAKAEQDGKAFLPWRSHLFHRAQGGVFACVDPECPHRDPELRAEDAYWTFGTIYLTPKSACLCGAPVFELSSCGECGHGWLQAKLNGGAKPWLEAPEPEEADDFALDAEPSENTKIETSAQVLLGAPGQGDYDGWVERKTGRLFDNPQAGEELYRLSVTETPVERRCCARAAQARLQPLRFGPNFFLGNAIPQALEDLVPTIEKPGLPSGGRRAISFTDSRQGVARLAAKLQQEAERGLTRAFLWHAVQERGEVGDPAQIAKLRADVDKLRNVGFEDMARDKERELAALTGSETRPVSWPDLVTRFAQQDDLRQFAGEVWRGRVLGEKIAEQPVELARLFLFRELFRRPRVQNNPETMGLLRLTFPILEKEALSAPVPEPLARAGVDSASWFGLAQAAIDFVFRDELAIDIPDWMVPIVSPRFGKLNVIAPNGLRPEERSNRSRIWPGPIIKSRPQRLQRLVYKLFEGNPDNAQHQDLAAEVLSSLWTMIARGAAKDVGKGQLRLDYGKAAVACFETGYLCPLTRRPMSYSVAGLSPYAPDRKMEPIAFPTLPVAHAGGLSSDQRHELVAWLEQDTQVAELRRRGLWSDLHDRLASYPLFLRSQEHSAQLQRKILKSYEDDFNTGNINLLNCSTTMEMGVDLEAVSLVVNANVPPALSNYRQRVGRAGRRGEPWAFGLTFCRDLPLDKQAFADPVKFLQRPISAPKVWFDSAPLVQRHVNAALLAFWLGKRGGVSIKASIGAFFGASGDPEAPFAGEADVDRFLEDMRDDWGRKPEPIRSLANLVMGTVLADVDPAALVDRCARQMEALVLAWRHDYRELLEMQQSAGDEDVAKAFELRAKRMAGAFLLGELAQRGFTPAYGFPTDVVSFDPLRSGRKAEDDEDRPSYQMRGGATRQLHQAIREYAPGAEVVIDGLVYQSEGVLPAWGADADSSKLEDFQDFWKCPSCHAFGVSGSGVPESCPECGKPELSFRKLLRPAGFLSRKAPHTGYEALTHIPYSQPDISAQNGDWLALPDAAVGRLRHDPSGLVVSRSAGAKRGGYAVCMACGRAEAMEQPDPLFQSALPQGMVKHLPLARGRGTRLTHDGYCPGGYTEAHRVQKHVDLAQIARTDVFEFQLPVEARYETALGVLAGLRSALAERLGVEAEEIGVSTGDSDGPVGDKRISGWLHDRAAGGAGLVARLMEPEIFSGSLERATQTLDCPEGCRYGCPACILRPDLNFGDVRIDRPGAAALAAGLLSKMVLPPALRVFGSETRALGISLIRHVERLHRAGELTAITLFLNGEPKDWDLQAWPAKAKLSEWNEGGVALSVRLPSTVLSRADFDLSQRLALYRLADSAVLELLSEPLKISGAQTLAQLEIRDGRRFLIAASDLAEAAPAASWGAGAAGPLLIGSAPELARLTRLSAEKLIEFSTGNARIQWPEEETDGAVDEFGRRFWAWLAKRNVLEVSAMRAVGVSRIRYSDRYLLTPATLLMAARVVAAAPGGKEAAVSFHLAAAQSGNGYRRAARVFDSYANDAERREVLKSLLPKAEIAIARSKAEMPHRREFVFELKDGREFRLLLDQGFGGWRCSSGHLGFDFSRAPDQQAKSLLQSNFTIEALGEPVVFQG